MSRLSRDEFEREYLNQIHPPTLLQWLDDFASQLDCPPPDLKLVSDSREYYIKFGEWQAQQHILAKLRYAIAAEKRLNPPKEKTG